MVLKKLMMGDFELKCVNRAVHSLFPSPVQVLFFNPLFATHHIPFNPASLRITLFTTPYEKKITQNNYIVNFIHQKFV